MIFSSFSIPDELVEIIIKNLDLKDILNFLLTSKSINIFKNKMYCRDWNIEEVNKYPSLIPFVRKLINVKSWDQLVIFKKATKITFCESVQNLGINPWSTFSNIEHIIYTSDKKYDIEYIFKYKNKKGTRIWDKFENIKRSNLIQ
jgi:hypothetical protein